MSQVFKVTTIAGNHNKGFQDGNALEAMFDRPNGICCSKDGKLYVTEYSNNTIRMIYNNQVIRIAGNGEKGFKDGNALEAMFAFPSGLCCSNDGTIYVVDNNNHAIRMIYNNQVTTIAGNAKKGFKDGNALEAMFDYPLGISISNDRRLYLADNNNHRIRMIYNGQVTTIAGNGEKGFKDGNAEDAMFNHPWEICCSRDGRLYVSDGYNYRIRMIYNNQVTTIAGNGQQGSNDGNAKDATFKSVGSICCSIDGKLYVSDQFNHTIRMIYNSQVTTIAGNSQGFQDGDAAYEARFNCPMGLCTSNDGKLYVADQHNHRIRMIRNIQDHKSAFGFALLLDMKNTFSDRQLSFNGVTYQLHSVFVNVRCPLLFDQEHFSLIQKSNISSKSFDLFVTFLYSNTLTKEYNQRWPTLPINNVVELTYMFDLLMNCKWILNNLKTTFTKQVTQMLTINQQESTRELITDLLPLIYNLKVLVGKRPILSNVTTKNISYVDYCYKKLVNELKNRRSIVDLHLKDLRSNLTDESYAIIMSDMMSERNRIETIDDESTMIFSTELTELSKLAFSKTNICLTADKQTEQSSLILTQHLDEWTRPDFIVKLHQDGIEYHVHKMVLCGRWKYFRLMFESGLKEVNDNEMTLSDDWSKPRFEKFIKYVYLNEMDYDDYDDFSDIEWLMENRKLYRITADGFEGEQYNENQTGEKAVYGFEDLYEYCTGVLRQQ